MSTVMGGAHQHGGRIVVGVDGSASAQQALRWAIRQATVTETPVEAITAWEMPPYHGMAPSLDVDLSGAAREVLDDAIDEAVKETGLSVRIEAHVMNANPATALINAARNADLLVVGSRGKGGFVQALLGSVSQRCAQHAGCPVVIVRAAAD
ncbi:universal stress protein [Actinocatenispora thailandica]|uniref:Universal stress protein n=1 Tax=Actinocatenispora thailandica TaxID=227318 RepID=A0A7R7DLQ9_9ACTN|nr:universal stress protein [Actinocatenispora thailandica]BCJ34034.1 universal stress protein [Actinocatenispora thailandica]